MKTGFAYLFAYDFQRKVTLSKDKHLYAVLHIGHPVFPFLHLVLRDYGAAGKSVTKSVQIAVNVQFGHGNLSRSKALQCLQG